MLHLVGVAGFFYKNQIVFCCGWHMTVQVTEEFGRVAVGKIIIGSDQKRSGMSNLFGLCKVAVLCRMDVVEKP